MESSKQEIELFTQLSRVGSKNLFHNMFVIYPEEFKWMLKAGNGIIQTGNGFIPCTSRPLNK